MDKIVSLSQIVYVEIEKELDGALPCGDDMVRAERLREVVFPQHC